MRRRRPRYPAESIAVDGKPTAYGAGLEQVDSLMMRGRAID
jgi:hypothetical protein